MADRFASKAARSLAVELGIDADSVAGTGRSGRLTVADVRAVAEADSVSAPAGLEEAGRALWQSIHSELPDDQEFDSRELAILERACRQADDIARCEAVIARDGVEAVGSAGQPVVSPYLVEARQGRVTLNRLLGAIGLPDEEDEPRTASSQRAQKAARARWDRRGHLEAQRGI